MISLEVFKAKSYDEKYKILVNILVQVEPKHIFADLRDFFKVVSKPSEESLVSIFELIEKLLEIALEKESSWNQEKLSLIQQKLRQMKDLEHKERQDLKGELEELLGSL